MAPQIGMFHGFKTEAVKLSFFAATVVLVQPTPLPITCSKKVAALSSNYSTPPSTVPFTNANGKLLVQLFVLLAVLSLLAEHVSPAFQM